MEFKEFRGRSVEDALTAASVELGMTSDQLDYKIIEKGSTGFLGIGSKSAVIRVSIKNESDSPDEVDTVSSETEDVAEDISTPEMPEEKEQISESEVVEAAKEVKETPQAEKKSRVYDEEKPVDKEEVISRAREFLSSVFAAMDIEVDLSIDFEEENRMLLINMNGPEMGIIIGKRGQTLDSLQYLTNLAVNRKLESYVRVKMDTEDYRKRRKATLENLAHHVSYKVRRTKRPVSLEPMNPYERRVIHFALQHDPFVKTESEGEEPYRHVVVSLK